MLPQSESELIARCRRGEPAAWDELFDRHYAATARFIFQLSRELTKEELKAEMHTLAGKLAENAVRAQKRARKSR